MSSAVPLVSSPLTASSSQNPICTSTTVVTLHKPEDITWDDFTAMMGVEGFPTCGKDGLIQCLMQAFGAPARRYVQAATHNHMHALVDSMSYSSYLLLLFILLPSGDALSRPGSDSSWTLMTHDDAQPNGQFVASV